MMLQTILSVQKYRQIDWKLVHRPQTTDYERHKTPNRVLRLFFSHIHWNIMHLAQGPIAS